MLKVLYSDRLLSDSHEISPSAIKPQFLAALLTNVEFIEPNPVTVADFERCHDIEFVKGILSLSLPNGFGTFSQKVVDSLPYTSGAVYDAALLADKYPTAALAAGFHHAGYGGFHNLGHFCTFNGLMVAACKLNKKVAIVDCDMHWGNGTDDIINRIDPKHEKYINLSFGKHFYYPSQAQAYLNYFNVVRGVLEKFRPDVILYQAGADVHIHDPQGGILTEDQMYQRDKSMFTIAKDLNIPISWSLAGGYQLDKNGSFNYIIKLHLNTFKACEEVYDLDSSSSVR